MSGWVAMRGQSDNPGILRLRAPEEDKEGKLYLKTNAIPWIATIPNLGVEYGFGNRWSAGADVLYCPWKLTDRFSIKTVAFLPEARYWLKNNSGGSFFNVHFSLAWYNVRMGNFRYQDDGRLLLGGGIGYGYRLGLSEKWALEFSLGVGLATTRYDRYYNVANGALKDTRSTFYFGIDRIGVSVVYNLCDL